MRRRQQQCSLGSLGNWWPLANTISYEIDKHTNHRDGRSDPPQNASTLPPEKHGKNQSGDHARQGDGFELRGGRGKDHTNVIRSERGAIPTGGVEFEHRPGARQAGREARE